MKVIRLELRPTYADLWEGKVMAEEWMSRIRQRHQQYYRRSPMILVPDLLSEDPLDSEVRWLPKVMYSARLEADRPVGNNGSYSQLDVIFFCSDVSASILTVVAEQVGKVEWKAVAEDVEP